MQESFTRMTPQPLTRIRGREIEPPSHSAGAVGISE